jgi:hypothetical protein
MSNFGAGDLEQALPEPEGVAVPVGEWGELQVSRRHDSIAAAIMMYAFAFFVCGILAVVLIVAARWAI